MNGIPVDCVMNGVTGNYNPPWTNQEDKLNNCLLKTGDYFKNDNITLNSIYSQYICTEGVGYNIINKYHFTMNGCNFHQDFELHFRNDAYLTKKSTASTSTMNSAVYNCDSRNFTLETYYTIMAKSFIGLAAAGSAYYPRIIQGISRSQSI